MGTPELSDLQKLELKEAFDEFDKDGSGTITTKELLPVLRSIGQNPSEDEILSLVIEYDVNGDGTIDFDEFVEMMTKQNLENVDQTAEIKEAFKMFDRDGNGYIDMKELRMVITPTKYNNEKCYTLWTQKNFIHLYLFVIM